MSQAASSPFAEVRLLGPVELGRRDGSSAGVGSGMERTLLAALAVNAGLVVSTGDLIDGLWGSAPPPTARHALHVHVSSLRHRLGVSPSPLEARPPGYVLKLDPGQLDTERFESLAATGRAELASNQPALAADALQAALAVWRGPALAGVAGDRLTGTEVARLEEVRRATEEDRLDAELAAGRSDRAAAMAEALAAAEPFRERRWGQLMLALYRSGRQAEALRRFVLVGDLLRDELGVDPSPALRDLHRRILTHDPGLELADLPAPPGVPGAAGRSPASPAATGPPSPTRSWATAPSTWCSSPASPATWRSAGRTRPSPVSSAASPPAAGWSCSTSAAPACPTAREATLRSPSTWTTSSP